MFRATCLLQFSTIDLFAFFRRSILFPILAFGVQSKLIFSQENPSFSQPSGEREFLFFGVQAEGEKSPNLIGVGNHLFCCLFLSHRTYNDLIFAFDKNEFYASFFLLASQNKTGRRRFGQNEDFLLFCFFLFSFSGGRAHCASDGFRFTKVF